MNIFLSIIIFIYTLNVQNNFEVLKTKSGREFKIFKGNDAKTIFFEFCIEKQKKECLVELLVFDLRGMESLENPNIGTTDIKITERLLELKMDSHTLLPQMEFPLKVLKVINSLML